MEGWKAHHPTLKMAVMGGCVGVPTVIESSDLKRQHQRHPFRYNLKYKTESIFLIPNGLFSIFESSIFPALCSF